MEPLSLPLSRRAGPITGSLARPLKIPHFLDHPAPQPGSTVIYSLEDAGVLKVYAQDPSGDRYELTNGSLSERSSALIAAPRRAATPRVSTIVVPDLGAVPAGTSRILRKLADQEVKGAAFQMDRHLGFELEAGAAYQFEAEISHQSEGKCGLELGMGGTVKAEDLSISARIFVQGFLAVGEGGELGAPILAVTDPAGRSVLKGTLTCVESGIFGPMYGQANPSSDSATILRRGGYMSVTRIPL